MTDAKAPTVAGLGRNRVEMQAQGLMLEMLGLAGEPRKAMQAALEKAYLGLVRVLRPEVVIEIGAHEGRFSRRAKQQLGDARVVAFEANPDVWMRHRDRLAAAGVEYRNQCVADRPGTVRFRVPLVGGRVRLTVGSMLDYAAGEDVVEHEVPAIRLDDEDFGRCVMWIDVEGAARPVLASAEATLAACQAIFIELEEDERWSGQMLAAEVLDHLEQRGFAAILRDVQRDWQYNAVLVRRDLLFDRRVLGLRQRYFDELRRLAGLAAPAAG